jgi:ribosomal protein S18 acetylase RimI-like enzyme
VHLRPAVPADAEGCAAVHVRGWQAAYAALAPGVADLEPADRLPRWRALLADGALRQFVVLDRDGTVAGFAGVEAAACELTSLYLDPSLHDAGWGGRLHDAGLDLLRAAGCTTAQLWVLEDNARARAFYTRRGWRPDGRRQTVDVAGSDLVEVGYGRAL